MLDIIEVTIPFKYADYTDVFLPDSAAELPEYISINNYLIDLIDDKQPPYCLIYNPGPVELKKLKIYIETNLASSFIRPFKSSANTPILFICKKDDSFQLCVKYWGLNNLTIKNLYPLTLISESLNCLGHVKRFTQFDLTNAYH